MTDIKVGISFEYEDVPYFLSFPLSSEVSVLTEDEATDVLCGRMNLEPNKVVITKVLWYPPF